MWVLPFLWGGSQNGQLWEPRGGPFRLMVILTWFGECLYAVCVLCAYVCLPQWHSFPNSFLTHWPIWVKFEGTDLRNIRPLKVFRKLGNWVEEKALSLWCCHWGKNCMTHIYIRKPKWKCKWVGNQATNFAVSLGFVCFFFLLSPLLPPCCRALPEYMCWLWYCMRRETGPWHCLSLLFLPADVEGSFSLPTPGSRGSSQCWGIGHQLHSLAWYKLFSPSSDFNRVAQSY